MSAGEMRALAAAQRAAPLLSQLELVECPDRRSGAGRCWCVVHANFPELPRIRPIAQGRYFGAANQWWPCVTPLSDGVWVVEAVGCQGEGPGPRDRGAEIASWAMA